jgi:3-oxoadipate enol-lactonase
MSDAARLVAGAAEAVLSVRPLVDVLDRPVRVASAAAGDAPAAALLTRVAAALEAPPLAVGGVGPEGVTVFERVVGERLAVDSWQAAACAEALAEPDLVERAVDETLRDSFERRCAVETVRSADGTPLRAYAAGPPDAPPVVVLNACGTPAKLSDRWVRALEDDHRVVLWETRGMVDDLDGGELRAAGVDAQVADVRAVMNHHGFQRAHVMGLCAGAAVAVTAAAELPDRVSSVSVWHGNVGLGPDRPKRAVQRDMEALLQLVASGAVAAGATYQTFCQVLASRPGTPWAHVFLHPFATPSLLSRYCRLVAPMSTTDLRPLLDRVAMPALVVTSEEDQTVHPDLMIQLAGLLPRATLHVAAHGDHLALFDADPALVDLVRRFMAAA